MAKKKTDNNMLSVDFFGDVCNEQTVITNKYTYKYGSKSVEIECRPYLTYNDKQSFVRSVWNVYYSIGENGTYDYRPYMTQLAIRYLTVIMYCVNVPISTNEDIVKYENFLINTTFYDELIKHINRDDYDALVDSVYKYIDIMTNIHAHVAEKAVDYTLRETLDVMKRMLTLLADKDFSLSDLVSGDKEDETA